MLRRVRRIAMLIGSLLLCLMPHLFWKMLPLSSPWPRRFLGLAARSAGARVRIEGRPLTQDVFFIANHVSWIDILAMGGATGTAFISHEGVASWPMIGWLARQNNTMFISRTDRHAVRHQIEALHAALKRHQPVTLFPEGTTSDGTGLLPFKPALLAGLMPPPRALKIQPVWIDYGEAVGDIAWHGNESAGANAGRILSRKGAIPLTLHFLEPFDPHAFPDRKAIAEEARNRISMRQSAFVARRTPV